MPLRLFNLLCTAALFVNAHPMGNFSVSHYSRFELGSRGQRLIYVLDLAEIPTFELFQRWDLRDAKDSRLEAKVREQARVWVAGLSLQRDGRALAPRIDEVETAVLDGAGGMPVMRVTMTLALPVGSGELEFEDRNFSGRAGWKEIVVQAGGGVSIVNSTHGTKDVSRGLTQYPADPALAPPQDLHASISWSVASLPQSKRPTTSAVSTPSPTPVEAAALPAPPPFVAQQPAPAGTVSRGDYLSRLLQRKELTLGMLLAGLLAAFGLGAMHALSPGHGKTIVAAYLIGTRGTLRHALFLGGMVTFTHTVSVFALGLCVLFFQQYILPERVVPVLGVFSGLSIVLIGGWLLYQRTKPLNHSHSHPHPHGHAHGSAHTHTHDGHTHTHVMPEQRIGLGSLVALGVSGGLVPCPSALILMLSAIAIGRTGFGLGLLVSFSLGLALVLMAIGGLVIYAKHLLPDGSRLRRHPAFRLVPVFSAVFVMILGMLMALTSLGWIQPAKLV